MNDDDYLSGFRLGKKLSDLKSDDDNHFVLLCEVGQSYKDACNRAAELVVASLIPLALYLTSVPEQECGAIVKMFIEQCLDHKHKSKKQKANFKTHFNRKIFLATHLVVVSSQQHRDAHGCCLLKHLCVSGVAWTVRRMFKLLSESVKDTATTVYEYIAEAKIQEGRHNEETNQRALEMKRKKTSADILRQGEEKMERQEEDEIDAGGASEHGELGSDEVGCAQDPVAGDGLSSPVQDDADELHDDEDEQPQSSHAAKEKEAHGQDHTAFPVHRVGQFSQIVFATASKLKLGDLSGLPLLPVIILVDLVQRNRLARVDPILASCLYPLPDLCGSSSANPVGAFATISGRILKQAAGIIERQAGMYVPLTRWIPVAAGRIKTNDLPGVLQVHGNLCHFHIIVYLGEMCYTLTKSAGRVITRHTMGMGSAIAVFPNQQCTIKKGTENSEWIIASFAFDGLLTTSDSGIPSDLTYFLSKKQVYFRSPTRTPGFGDLKFTHGVAVVESPDGNSDVLVNVQKVLNLISLKFSMDRSRQFQLPQNRNSPICQQHEIEIGHIKSVLGEEKGLATFVAGALGGSFDENTSCLGGFGPTAFITQSRSAVLVFLGGPWTVVEVTSGTTRKCVCVCVSTLM